MTVWDEPCFWLFTPLPLHLSTSPCWSPSLRPLLHCRCVLTAVFRQQLVIGLKHSFLARWWATLEVSRRKPSPRCCVGNIFTATIHYLCLHLTQRPGPSDAFACYRVLTQSSFLSFFSNEIYSLTESKAEFHDKLILVFKKKFSDKRKAWIRVDYCLFGVRLECIWHSPQKRENLNMRLYLDMHWS